MTKIVKIASLIVLNPIITFGLYIISHGHLTPGGGFQGGVIIAGATALLLVVFLPGTALATKAMLKRGLFSFFESLGVSFFIILAFLGLFKNTFLYNFLANTAGVLGRTIHFGVNPGYLNSGGVIPLMNLAVGMEVVSGLSLIIILMMSRKNYKNHYH